MVNLRREPSAAAPSYSHDDLLETQLLFNERVTLRDEEGGWCFVEAVEQEVFRKHDRWQGYPGWVSMGSLRPAGPGPEARDATVGSSRAPVFKDGPGSGDVRYVLSLGTRLAIHDMGRGREGFSAIDLGDGEYGWIEDARLRRTQGTTLDNKRKREDILATAGLFLGTPYLWGGRSMYMSRLHGIATGVDCSGLVNLAFRVQGIDIPRDAHEQWMKAEHIGSEMLEPADLIFVCRETGVVSHVMLFAGGESFIEAAETGGKVRISTFREKFGEDLATLSRLGGLGTGEEILFGRAPLSL